MINSSRPSPSMSWSPAPPGVDGSSSSSIVCTTAPDGSVTVTFTALGFGNSGTLQYFTAKSRSPECKVQSTCGDLPDGVITGLACGHDGKEVSARTTGETVLVAAIVT